MSKRWLLLLLAADVASAHAQEATSAQMDWIRENAIVFETVDAGRDFKDLEPLKQLVGDARIVSLGEPTHARARSFR